MPDSLSLLLAVFGLLSIVILLAGRKLAEYADAIGDLTGMGGSLAGLILLAAATSLPELAVDCAAAVIPARDLAIGAVLGSCLFNLLILGILDLTSLGGGRLISPASAEHGLTALTSLMLTAMASLFIVLPLELSIWNIGLGSPLLALVYLFGLRLVWLDQTARRGEISGETETVAGKSLPRAVVGYLVTTAIIFVAANYLAPVAEKIALLSGLGETFVGSTFVAIATSLPEVVTTIAAVRIGATQMAVGNILGSNTFNMIILFPVDVVYRQGSLLYGAEQQHLLTALSVIMMTSVVIAAFLYRGKSLRRGFDPGPRLVVALGIATLVALYYLSGEPGL